MNILNRIWDILKGAFFAWWYVIVALIIAIIIYFIWGLQAAVFTGFGIVLAVILFVFARQFWWFISGTGDYQGRVGLLKRLWCLIFKIKIDEDQD